MLLEPGEPQDEGVRRALQDVWLERLRVSIGELELDRLGTLLHSIEDVAVKREDREGLRQCDQRNLEAIY